jgi:hypothetical protein
MGYDRGSPRVLIHGPQEMWYSKLIYRNDGLETRIDYSSHTR